MDDFVKCEECKYLNDCPAGFSYCNSACLIIQTKQENANEMIDREKVLYGLEQIADTTQRSDLQELMEGAIALLKKQPEIVRCKDCKYSVDSGKKSILLCRVDGVYSASRLKYPEGYCDEGKRKE